MSPSLESVEPRGEWEGVRVRGGSNCPSAVSVIRVDFLPLGSTKSWTRSCRRAWAGVPLLHFQGQLTVIAEYWALKIWPAGPNLLTDDELIVDSRWVESFVALFYGSTTAPLAGSSQMRPRTGVVKWRHLIDRFLKMRMGGFILCCWRFINLLMRPMKKCFVRRLFAWRIISLFIEINYRFQVKQCMDP